MKTELLEDQGVKGIKTPSFETWCAVKTCGAYGEIRN